MRHILSLTLILISFICNAQDYNLTIEVTKITSRSGVIRIGVYNHENQFTEHPIKNIVILKNEMINGTVKKQINLPAGIYAFTLLDDENNNNKMDYNFIIYPKEGYGFSNNAKVKGLNPPSFNDCKILLDKDKKIPIEVIR